MAHHSGRLINLTIKVDSGVLLLAKHRALLERTSVNAYLGDVLEDYADGTMDAARRTNTAAYVFGVVEEVRRLRRHSKAVRRPISLATLPGDETETEEAVAHHTVYVQHEDTAAREHEGTKEV
jgi:hypothetical protein